MRITSLPFQAPLLCAALLITGGISQPAQAANPQRTDAGITGVAPNPAVRFRVPDAPPDKIWLYQLALPFQVSATQAGIFCNVREALAQGVDFEAGNDVIVFGSIIEMETARPVIVSRNHAEINPNSAPKGKPATMVKYPIRGGFVPLGAKRKDGSPHPHAGTGFGLSLAQGWKTLVDGPPPYLQNSFRDAEAYSYWEFHQFAFDGKEFRVTATDRVAMDRLLADWVISNGGMANAIADGDDMLIAMVARKAKPEGPNGTRAPSGSGIMRLRRSGGQWRPVGLFHVPGSTSLWEPSIVRDIDGSLLFSGRGGREPDHMTDVRVWRSRDNGQQWQLVVDVKGIVSPAPITLNQAADGTPYIAANLQSVVVPTEMTRSSSGAAATPLVGKNSRNTLTIWPLNAARNGLADPIQVRDCRAEFGPPGGGSNWTWRADHPSAMTVRLADGKWHNMLGVRIQDYREIKDAMPPTPKTGMYLHEVISRGQPHPVWNF